MSRAVQIRCDDCEVAWAAGFFDGEGFVYATMQGKYMAFHLQVVQSGESMPHVISRFQKAIGLEGGFIFGPQRPYGVQRLPKWGYRLSNKKRITEAMEKLYPFLSEVKRAQWDAVKARMVEYEGRPVKAVVEVGA